MGDRFDALYGIEDMEDPPTLRSPQYATPIPASRITVPVAAVVGLHDVPSVRRGHRGAVENDSLKQLVLGYIDGCTSVEQIADAAGVSFEVVQAVVAELQDQGVLALWRAPSESDVHMVSRYSGEDETLIMEMQMHLRHTK
jgi:hypothetical protein